MADDWKVILYICLGLKTRYKESKAVRSCFYIYNQTDFTVIIYKNIIKMTMLI